MKEPPTDLDRCLAILVLRRADCSQDAVAGIVRCGKLTVGRVERWFTEQLSYSEAVKLCSDTVIKRVINIDLVPKEEVDKELLEKIVQITGDDIVRHYRKTDYIERRDPILQKYLMEWWEQLNHPPPERIYIVRLGRVGEDNNASLGQRIVDVALENVRFDVRVTQTTLYPDYAYTSDKIFWELPLDGPPKLLCPVERQPRFKELLSKLTPEGRQSFESRKSVGGEVIVGCMHALKTVRDVANARAGQLLGLVGVDSVFERLRSDLSLPWPGPRSPSHLNIEFADLIYSLSIKCRRDPSIFQVIKGLYGIRQKGVLHYDLVFGQQEGSPLATGLSFEMEQCIHLNQSLVKEFAQSKVISQLIEMDARLLTLEKVVKADLTKIIDKGGVNSL
ncbi:hypothetical protein ES703_21103 [subsurface metagenome]